MVATPKAVGSCERQAEARAQSSSEAMAPPCTSPAAVGLIRLKAHADLGAVLADAFTAELHGAGHGHGQAEEDAGRLAFEGVGRVVFDGVFMRAIIASA